MTKAQLEAVSALRRAIYGDSTIAPTGVIHIASAIRCTPGRWHVIKIQEGAPKSSTDAFVLSLWRAHCDAVLTTGQILRAEPSLSYAHKGPWALGLTRYREEVLGKPGPLRCAIMTRSSQLPPEHPVFREASGIEPLVVTTPQNVAELSQVLEDRAKVVGIEQLDAARALEFLKRSGSQTIGVEAGPSVAGTLYGAQQQVTHLMLSICEAPVEAHVVGGALPADEELFNGLRLVSDVTRAEESGAWRFQHWQRYESLQRPAKP